MLAAAEELVDQHGVDAVTMTLLAHSLGTKVSSLYNHVDNLEDLRSELQLRALGQLARRVRSAAMGHTGTEGLQSLADAFLAFAREHPHRYDAMTRTPVDRERYFAAAAEAIEAVAVMVGTTAVPEEQSLVAQMALFAALHGFASLEATGFFAPLEGLNISHDAVYAQVSSGAIAAILEHRPDSGAPRP